MWIYRTISDYITCLNHLSFSVNIINHDTWIKRNRICSDFTCLFVSNNNFSLLLSLFNLCKTVDFRKNCNSLRLSGLEEFFNSRKTLSDIVTTGDTAWVEVSHCKLCTRLTDWLSSDNTNCFTNLNCLTCSKVRTVTLRTDTVLALTCKNSTNLSFLNSGFNYIINSSWCDEVISLNQYITCLINNVFCSISSKKSVRNWLNYFLTCAEAFNFHSRNCSSVLRTIHFSDNKLLWYVYKTTCKVSWVSCTKSSIRKSLTSTMSWNEILKYVKTFTEVRLNRKFDCTSHCISHTSTHTCKLFNLLVRTTGSWVSHHEQVIILIKTIDKEVLKLFVGIFPCSYYWLITLFFCDDTTSVVLSNLINSLLCFIKHFCFLSRHCHIWYRYCHCSAGWVLITHSLDVIKNFCCLSSSVCVDNLLKNLLKSFLTNMLVYFKLK